MSDTTVWPCLTYTDADAAVAFLERAFGFASTAVHRDGGEQIVHAESRRPDGAGVMFGSHRAHPDAEYMARLRPGGAVVYVVTDDPDGDHARAAAAGAEILQALQVTDYGSRSFVAADPEGNVWSFGTYAGA